MLLCSIVFVVVVWFWQFLNEHGTFWKNVSYKRGFVTFCLMWSHFFRHVEFLLLISVGNGRGGESIYGGYFEGNGNVRLSNKQSINVFSEYFGASDYVIFAWAQCCTFLVLMIFFLCMTPLTFTFPLYSVVFYLVTVVGFIKSAWRVGILFIENYNLPA